MGNDYLPPQSAQSTQRLNCLSREIIGAAIEVHRHLGPGLLESAYETCLIQELHERNVPIAVQVPLPLSYKGVALEAGYRLDLVVDGCVIVELKAVDHLERVHVAQLMSYLRLSGLPLGLLINFNAAKLVEGVRRIANAPMNQ
jgi:GxxExxY protein